MKFLGAIITDTPDNPAVQEGDIVTWDKQPKAVRHLPGREGRTVAQVTRASDPDYITIATLKTKDWLEWDRATFCDRLNAGEVTIEDKWQLLKAIEKAFFAEGNDDVAYAINDLVRNHGPKVEI